MGQETENNKTRVRKATNHIKQSYLPTQIDATPEMREKIIRLLSTDIGNLDEKLDNHIRYFTLNDKVKKDNINGIQYDIWGIGWDTVKTEGFYIRYHPLLDCENLKGFKFPVPEKKHVEEIERIDEDTAKKYYIVFDDGFTLFERLWMLRGFENTLSDFYFNKREIEYLLDGINDYNMEIADMVIKLNTIDGVYTGDDFGTQRGMIISPEMWKILFKKRYARLWQKYRENNISVFHHSCGNIMKIIPDLIETGLNVLTPVQPEAMDIKELSDKFGKELSFLGGISTQTLLPFGSTEDIEKSVRETIDFLGKYNGYIISPSHEVTSDCPEKNFLFLLEIFEKYKNGLL